MTGGSIKGKTPLKRTWTKKSREVDMTARKPTSDEQFEYDGPKTRLDELFDHHGYQVFDVIEEGEGEEE